jgi:hypothetical protein
MSTSQLPEEEGPERRAGFEVISSAAAELLPRQEPYQLKIAAARAGSSLEEAEHFVNLYAASVACTETRLLIKIDNGPWEPCPRLSAAQTDCFTAEGLQNALEGLRDGRRVTSGVTHFKLCFGQPTLERLVAYAATLKPPAEPPKPVQADPKTKPAGALSGIVSIAANLVDTPGVRFVTLSVDGAVRYISNSAPYEFVWDTRQETNGPHELEIAAIAADGSTIVSKKQKVVVFN